jgi:microcystin-dependent protein
MVESLTQNYKWTKPEITKSPATWGTFLNSTTDSIDSILFAAQNAGAPIGSIIMFAGGYAPANWLLCNGAVYNNSDIPLLAPIIGNAYNAGTSAVAGTSTALPNLVQRFPMGMGLNPIGQSGGAFSYTLSLANMPAHAHTINISDPSHYHTIPAWQHTHTAYQDGHVHAAWQDVHAHTVANSPHAHNIVTGGHNHGVHTGGHSHGLDHQVMTTSGGGSGAPQAGGWLFQNVRTDSAGDLGGYTDSAGNLGGYTDAQYANVGNTDNRQPGVYTDNRQPAVHISTDVANIYYADWAGTNISASSVAVGSYAPISIVPPYLAINFIVRYK